MSDEEREKLEEEFQYALDNIVSKIKGETATAIVYSEQSMILLFKKLMFKIEKQSKEIEELEKNRKVSQNFAKIVATDYISKDKIKAKIEELDYNDIGNFERRCKQEVLQSLLEKE